MKREVVITGVGAVTPLGNGAEVLFDGWAAGKSGIEDGVGRCSAFQPRDMFSRREIRRIDRFTQMAAAASEEALIHAGWGEELPYPPERIGCVIGTAIGGMETAQATLTAGRPNALTIPLMMPNAAAGYMAMRRGLWGPAFGTVSACAAGTDAIGVALRLLRSGEVDAVITGGAEAPLIDTVIDAFAIMEATSPTGICRPFDARRDGFIMSEGAGILILEDGDAARTRGQRPLATLAGYGATADAFHLIAPDPEGAGAARAIRAALEDASASSDDIAYVNAHGTSTVLNDRSETKALKTALGAAAYRVPVSSTKSAIGHALGASGAIESVATVLTLDRRLMPPTLNYAEPDEELDLDYVVDGPRQLLTGKTGNGKAPAHALSNSFGFGGHNSVLCFTAID